MFLFKKRKGGVELVSIIILAVILGAATISIAVGLSKNAKNTAEGGLSANNSHLSALYQSLEDNLSDISSPGGGGGGEVEYGTAGSAQVLEGYTIATTVGLIEGTMRRNGLINAELTTQNASYSIPEGYHDGTGKVTASFSNLVAENIKDGVNIGGVVGNYNGNYNAKQFSSGSFSQVVPSYSYPSINLVTMNKTISGLSFTPTTVILYTEYSRGNDVIIANLTAVKNTFAMSSVSKKNYLSASGTSFNAGESLDAVTFTSGGFTINKMKFAVGTDNSLTISINWIAFE